MKRCPVCNKVIPQGHGYHRNQKYCSNECYLKKPPKVIETEQIYGKGIRELLRMNTNKTVLADLLGVSKSQLFVWIKKYEKVSNL